MLCLSSGSRPDPVISLTVTTQTATSITITWSVSSTTVIPITGFEVTYSYTVRRCSAPPGASRTDPISDGTRRSHILNGLNEDSDYTITVRTFNDVGSSMNSTTRGTTDTSGSHMNLISTVIIMYQQPQLPVLVPLQSHMVLWEW